MSLLRLLHSLQDALVDAEGDGDGEQGQGYVGAHADDAAHRQRQQQEQTRPKHHPRPLGVTPVHEVHHCERARDCTDMDGKGKRKTQRERVRFIRSMVFKYIVMTPSALYSVISCKGLL